MALPSDWSDQTVATFVGSPGETGSPVVTIARFPDIEEKTSDEFARSQLKAITEAIGPEVFELIEEGPIEWSGLPAHRATYDFAASLTRPLLRQMQTFLVDEGVGYIVTAVHERESFVAQTGGILRFVDSVLFRQHR